MTTKGAWRARAPQQAAQASKAQWAQVKVVHAQWQVEEPALKMNETVQRLLAYALEHVSAI